MSLDNSDLMTMANALYMADRKKSPIPPLTASHGVSVEDAYAIQLLNINRRVSEGERLVGHKVGLTSLVMQEMLGVNEPDFGRLFESMILADGAVVERHRFLQPRVEVEVAFRLHSALRGPGITVERVLDATDSVAPSIEIIDSRIENWQIKLPDTIADNASSAGVVLGEFISITKNLKLQNLEAELLVNDEVVATGTGSDVLGHPAAAIAWLANKLADFGLGLAAGDIVMPGSCTKAVDVRNGDHVHATFTQIGDVSFWVAK